MTMCGSVIVTVYRNQRVKKSDKNRYSSS